MDKRVLLVDDNNSVRIVLKTMLVSQGYAVVEACDGLDGLTKAKKQDFDIFIIDYKMPVMDGVTLVKRVKEMAGYIEQPVVLLTTDDGAEFQSKIAQIKGIDVLCKPIEQSQLLAIINRQQLSTAALTA